MFELTILEHGFAVPKQKVIPNYFDNYRTYVLNKLRDSNDHRLGAGVYENIRSVLFEEYHAVLNCYDNSPEYKRYYIQFESQNDCTEFMLRWS